MEAANQNPLVLVGYRLMPIWVVPSSMEDPLLPARVVTISDHLVDAVPDDDTWFDSWSAAENVRANSPDASSAKVLAMGLQTSDAQTAITHRLTVNTGQLCLNERTRTQFPAAPDLLGYELICDFHSWLCYAGMLSWAHRVAGIQVNDHGLIANLGDARRLASVADEVGSGLPPIPWIPVAIAAQ